MLHREVYLIMVWTDQLLLFIILKKDFEFCFRRVKNSFILSV